MKVKIISGLALIAAAIITTGSCKDAQQLNFDHYYANGRRLYQQHCQNCHAEGGGGLGRLIPPLSDSLFLRKNKSQLACLIKGGILGPVDVNGIKYNGQMPGNPSLTAIDVAEIVTYVSNSFGNKQGLYDVRQSQSDCP